ncbi:7272_t:CDS:1, partial [Scutellospora calospora]
DTNSLNIEISDINIANSNNDIGSEYLGKKNKKIKDNEEYDLTYISETDF